MGLEYENLHFILSSPLISCVILYKLINFCGSQFLHLLKRCINTPNVSMPHSVPEKSKRNAFLKLGYYTKINIISGKKCIIVYKLV